MSMFGEGVRLLRTYRGMSQGQLAAAVKVKRGRPTASWISRIESGRIDPSLTAIRALARALRVKPWQLLAYPESADWWQSYLSLPPIGKREVQRVIRWYGR